MSLPALNIANRQRRQPAHLKLWRKFAELALPQCLAACKSDDAPLRHLQEIDIVFVSDRTIARIHGEFLNDPTPTDVITFHHGETIISLDAARRQCEQNGLSYEHEAALYIIHGLLHLAGWDDHEAAEADTMHALQDRILAEAIGVQPSGCP
jgi:probable rRNA maturation factor